MGRMPKKKYHIRLSGAERQELEAIVGKGKASAQRQCHARILLLADTDGPEGGWSDSQIARAAQTIPYELLCGITQRVAATLI